MGLLGLRDGRGWRSKGEAERREIRKENGEEGFCAGIKFTELLATTNVVVETVIGCHQKVVTSLKKLALQ